MKSATQSGQRLNHHRIAAFPVRQGLIVRDPAEGLLPGRPAELKAAFRDQVGRDLPPLSRPLSSVVGTSFSAAFSSAMAA